MRIEIQLKSVSPLLMHNVQLADPDNKIVQEIKTYTGKRKKTEDDRRAIEKLEWFGGLYLGKNGPVIPTHMLRKCIVNTARISKLGKQVERALLFTDFEVPLSYKGSRDPVQLFASGDFSHRSVVGIQRAKTVRVRPKFTDWACVAHAELLKDVLDLDDLSRIVALAGTAEGIGDGRTIGFGRFEGVVKAM